MIKETFKYPSFSQTDFIKLYCAVNFKNGYSPIIKQHELEKRLYEFSSLTEFRELFQDICLKKDYINPENSYLDLGTALQTAQLFGLLELVHRVGETIYIICCGENMYHEIISNTDAEMVNKMKDLFNTMFEIDNNSKKKGDTQISSDEEFNRNKVNSYGKLLESSICQEEQGPKLVKIKNNN